MQWACGVPALISSVSDRDPSGLRDMQRLGLLPGTAIVVQAGSRNSSMLVQIGGQPKPVRLSQKLTDQIWVVPA